MAVKIKEFRDDWNKFREFIFDEGRYDNFEHASQVMGVEYIFRNYHLWLSKKLNVHLRELKEDETHPRYAFMRKFKVGDLLFVKKGYMALWAGKVYKITSFHTNYFLARLVHNRLDESAEEDFQYEVDNFEFATDEQIRDAGSRDITGLGSQGI